MTTALVQWTASMLSVKQGEALRTVAATGVDGLPTEINGRVSINGHCKNALMGSAWYGAEQREALIEVRQDPGEGRWVKKTRNFAGYTAYTSRYFLTAAGQALLATL